MYIAKNGSRTIATLMAIPILLTGCVGPRSQTAIDEKKGVAIAAETPSPPKEWTQPSDPTAIEVGWIHSFKDPALVELVKEAQANNKNLQAASASLERALALADQAGAALKPTADLSTGGTRSGKLEGGGLPSELSIGLRVGWEVDLWGRIGANVRAAEASAEAAEADYRYAQHSLAAATTKAYVTAIAAQKQVEVSNETLSILEETLRIVNAKQEGGLISPQDVALTRSDLARVREGLATVEGSQKDAIRALEILLGRYPGAELDVQRTLPDIPLAPKAGIPSELLERRPDIVSAERQVASAFNLVAEAKAARLPRLSLTSNIGGAAGNLGDLFRPEQAVWQLGANLLTPILDGGARKAQMRVTTADQKQALAIYGETVLNAFNEVETLLAQGDVLDRREKQLEEAMQQAKEAYRIADLRYQAGETELLDALSIQQRLTAAMSDLVTVQRLLLEQRVNLHLALGGQWDG